MNIRQIGLWLFAAVFAISIVAETANADYRVSVVDLEHKTTGEVKRILHLSGDIQEGISKDTEYLLNKYTVDQAVLFSPGGLSYEGYKLGWLFSDKLVNTYVARETYCFSACAIAFIGGTNYKINGGILGFHKGHLGGLESFKNQEEAFDKGQTAGSYSLAYILNNGFSYWLDRKINETTSPEIFLGFTSEDELMKYYVRDKENNLNTYFVEPQDAGSLFGYDEVINHFKDNPNENTWRVLKIVEMKENINEISK